MQFSEVKCPFLSLFRKKLITIVIEGLSTFDMNIKTLIHIYANDELLICSG